MDNEINYITLSNALAWEHVIDFAESPNYEIPLLKKYIKFYLGFLYVDFASG